MSPARINIVKQAFYALDPDRKGYISLSELLKKFDASVHPRVKTREKTPEEVYKEFEFAISRKAYNAFLIFIVRRM